MKLHITHEKTYLIFLLADYMNRLLIDKKIDLIINGKKETGRVSSVTLEDAPYNHIILSLGEKATLLPILNTTKVRLGKEMVKMETDNHYTIIDILD